MGQTFAYDSEGTPYASDPAWPDAGSGIIAENNNPYLDTYVTGNAPTDANVASDVTFQTGWVQHLISTWGTAAAGGLKYYLLDNEPSIWYLVHRDVHPTGAKMAEVLNDITSYGSAIKNLDPNALLVGPEEAGWSSYFYSGYDQQYAQLNNYNGVYPDQAANGGMYYLPWLLQQLLTYDSNTAHHRTLDVFSVHYYPQGSQSLGVYEYSDDVTTDTQLLRNMSTRSLWDPTYTDQSWINAVVDLIPLLKGWASTYYPQTFGEYYTETIGEIGEIVQHTFWLYTPAVGITEYNWGAESHINGATAQADILGIFGWQGLDLATRWTCPAPGSPVYQAIQMYRNYDGAMSTFGNTSISAASTANVWDLSVFAAERSKDRALTIMVINKDLQPSGSIITTPITLNLPNFPKSAKVRVWQLAAQNGDPYTCAITQLPALHVRGGSLATTVPNQSITLFVVQQPSLVSAIEMLLLGNSN